MSNTNNYCLEFLLTTYDITVVNETMQFTHIILQIDILQRNNDLSLDLKFYLVAWQRRFQLKFYIFTVLIFECHDMKVVW